jgi:hypothetical protein
MFWVAPLVDAAIAGVVYRWLGREDTDIIGEADLISEIALLGNGLRAIIPERGQS